MNNFFLIILDGVGVGELPDASNYGDAGSDTLCNIAKSVNGLHLPNLEKMGLGKIKDIAGIKNIANPLASFGKMNEVSKGKDSTTGHWEIGGLRIGFDFSYFPNGFPNQIVDKFLHLTGCKGILGNKPASGTEIIKELGDKHVKTGYPIIYTSADSVFQIAAHEEVIPLQSQYNICEITRFKVLTPPLIVGRVIARPFLGQNGDYIRTTNRRDYSLDPPSETVLDILFNENIQTVAIGKISDLFNNRGIKIAEHTKTNQEEMIKLIEYSKKVNNSFIFVNLVDFDVYFGHRNDPEGFAKALMEFDNFLPEFLSNLDETDALIITADHGNDPTTASTDHSREYVPLLFYQKGKKSVNLGIRNTFADAGKTICDFFNARNSLEGISLLIKD